MKGLKAKRIQRNSFPVVEAGVSALQCFTQPPAHTVPAWQCLATTAEHCWVHTAVNAKQLRGQHQKPASYCCKGVKRNGEGGESGPGCIAFWEACFGAQRTQSDCVWETKLNTDSSGLPYRCQSPALFTFKISTWSSTETEKNHPGKPPAQLSPSQQLR